MPPSFQLLLVLHVIFGLLGVAGSYATWMASLKGRLSLVFLRTASVSALIAYLLSWLAGGYYYAVYYGAVVKPVIKAGPYPLAHAIIMESKEHLFLLLPALAAVMTLVIWLCGALLEASPQLRRALSFLAGVATVLGALIAIAGVIISGAVRQ